MTNIEAAKIIVELYGICKNYGYNGDNCEEAVAMACQALMNNEKEK